MSTQPERPKSFEEILATSGQGQRAPGSPVIDLTAALRERSAPGTTYNLGDLGSIGSDEDTPLLNALLRREQATESAVPPEVSEQASAEAPFLAPVARAHTDISKLHGLEEIATPEVDLGVSFDALLRRRETDSQHPHSVEKIMAEKLINGTHDLTPSEGAEFVAPQDEVAKPVVLRRPHEIDIQYVGTQVDESLAHLGDFNRQAGMVVEDARAFARQSFQDAVNAYHILQGAEGWHANAIAGSEQLGAAIAERFELFREAREAAWEAQERSEEFTEQLIMRNSDLNKFGLTDRALNADLARTRREDNENSEKFALLNQRFREIQQTLRTNPQAPFFQQADVEVFDLARHAESPDQEYNFHRAVQDAIANPYGTAAQHLREVVQHEKPHLATEYLEEGKRLEGVIAVTQSELERNREAIRLATADVERLKREKKEFLVGVYDPALEAMTQTLADLEAVIGLAYVRSAQVASAARQIESSQAAQIERRKAADEAQRRQELAAIQDRPAGAPAREYTGRRADENQPIDDRRFPAPEVVAAPRGIRGLGQTVLKAFRRN